MLHIRSYRRSNISDINNHVGKSTLVIGNEAETTIKKLSDGDRKRFFLIMR